MRPDLGAPHGVCASPGSDETGTSLRGGRRKVPQHITDVGREIEGQRVVQRGESDGL